MISWRDPDKCAETMRATSRQSAGRGASTGCPRPARVAIRRRARSSAFTMNVGSLTFGSGIFRQQIEDEAAVP